jgi:hypothetical protein
MQSAANRFANLFGRRSDKAVAVSKSRRRAAKSRLATNFESLESRAMLALTTGDAYAGSGITAALTADYTSLASTTTVTGVAPALTTTTVNTYTNLFSTLDVTIGSDTDVFIFRTGNTTSFYNSDSLSTSGLLFSITDDSTATLPATIVNGVTTATATFPFASIAISASDAADSPRVYVVGGGQNINKQSLGIDLTNPATGQAFEGSEVYLGTPVFSAGAGAFGARTLSQTYAAGSLVLAAEAIDLSADVTSTTDATLRTGGDGTASADQGITIRRALSVTGGDATIVSSGADVRVRAGGSITGAAGAPLSTSPTPVRLSPGRSLRPRTSSCSAARLWEPQTPSSVRSRPRMPERVFRREPLAAQICSSR